MAGWGRYPKAAYAGGLEAVGERGSRGFSEMFKAKQVPGVPTSPEPTAS